MKTPRGSLGFSFSDQATGSGQFTEGKVFAVYSCRGVVYHPNSRSVAGRSGARRAILLKPPSLPLGSYFL